MGEESAGRSCVRTAGFSPLNRSAWNYFPGNNNNNDPRDRGPAGGQGAAARRTFRGEADRRLGWRGWGRDVIQRRDELMSTRDDFRGNPLCEEGFGSSWGGGDGAKIESDRPPPFVSHVTSEHGRRGIFAGLRPWLYRRPTSRTMFIRTVRQPPPAA